GELLGAPTVAAGGEVALLVGAPVLAQQGGADARQGDAGRRRRVGFSGGQAEEQAGQSGVVHSDLAAAGAQRHNSRIIPRPERRKYFLPNLPGFLHAGPRGLRSLILIRSEIRQMDSATPATVRTGSTV